VSVLMHWHRVGCGRAVHGTRPVRVVVVALAEAPAIVSTPRATVDLLPGLISHVVYEDGARAGLDGELEGVA
jgi:hypothetical protein